MMDDKKIELLHKIEELAPTYYEISDFICDHPELGYQEFQSSAALEDQLEKAGFAVERGIAEIPTAFKAVYEHGSGGPSFGLLVEYDALEGLGHACGHHMQGPSLLLCADAFKQVMQDDPYKLVVYGTPAEETSPAKLYMWERGCFRDIDIALMVHASYETACDLNSLAKVTIKVTFHGKNAHAAMFPEIGRSAFDALLLTFQGVEFLREHVTEDVRMHYTCLDAGGQENVVPSHAVGSFTLRSRYSLKNLNAIKERFFDIVKGAALMSGVTYEIEEGETWPNKIPAVELNKIILRNAEEIGCPDMAPPRERPGSTDFSAVMYHIPGCNLRIKYVDKPVKSHTPAFAAAGKTDMAHRSILLCSQAIAGTCYDILRDPSLMTKIKEDYAKTRETYE